MFADIREPWKRSMTPPPESRLALQFAYAARPARLFVRSR